MKRRCSFCFAISIARGRRREAQRRYQTFARRLEQEMGLTPLPETRELVEVG